MKPVARILIGVASLVPMAISPAIRTTRAPAAEPLVSDQGDDSARVASSLSEARWRARLLHETLRGNLQIMHRDFFDEDGSGAIPSASMEDVFHELSRGFDVDVHWLVVNTDAVNVDHRPKNDFERAAVTALASGKEWFDSSEASETSEGMRYRAVGPIRLRSQCLKCHVKRRTDNRERVAGLVISMPLRSESSTLPPATQLPAAQSPTGLAPSGLAPTAQRDSESGRSK